MVGLFYYYYWFSSKGIFQALASSCPLVIIGCSSKMEVAGTFQEPFSNSVVAVKADLEESCFWIEMY